MSGGLACRSQYHRRAWVVLDRNVNHSAFNGYRATPSRYSTVHCPICNAVWRTAAAYVDKLPCAVPECGER